MPSWGHRYVEGEHYAKNWAQKKKRHIQEAQKSHEYYVEVSTRCTNEWNEILALEDKPILTEEEAWKIAIFKK